MELIMEQFPIVIQSLNVGFLQTLKLFFVTLLGALPLGLIIAFGSMSHFRPLKYITNIIVWVVRGTPLMIQMLIIYYFPGLVLHKQIWGGGETGRFLAASLSFVLNYACYFSEIYRGGIESMPVGQYEAAKILGYNKVQTFFRIILPQVIKRILPSITNEVITLVKDTSLAFVVAVAEMFTIAKQIASAQTTMMPFVIAAIFYYVFNLIVAVVMQKVEKSMNYYR